METKPTQKTKRLIHQYLPFRWLAKPSFQINTVGFYRVYFGPDVVPTFKLRG